jgi:hypothetical protein
MDMLEKFTKAGHGLPGFFYECSERAIISCNFLFPYAEKGDTEQGKMLFFFTFVILPIALPR